MTATMERPRAQSPWLDDDIREAWRESVLSDLPEPAARRLLAGAWVSSAAAGEVFYRGWQHADMAMLGVVVDGLARTFLRAPDGRQVTIRYAGAGAVVGVPALLLDRPFMHVDAQAVFDTRILRLPLNEFRALAERESAVAWPIARFLAEQLTEIQECLAADLFLDVRSRVARHLLDLAVADDGELVVAATHQDVADAIGSVREVVSRAIKRMQDEQVVERVGGSMVIRAPASLHAIASGPPGGVARPETDTSTGGTTHAERRTRRVRDNRGGGRERPCAGAGDR